MSQIEKTVFISYRRADGEAWALAVFQNLTQHGYDVFFDYEGIASGDFEQIILQNIRARAHFVVVLTPLALTRIDEPGDWLRREIEAALDHRRNIVPLLFKGFDFSDASQASRLSGTLAPLKNYNGLRVWSEYFNEGMERLRTRHLNIPVEAVLHPASAAATEVAAQQRIAASVATQAPLEVLEAVEVAPVASLGFTETSPRQQVDASAAEALLQKGIDSIEVPARVDEIPIEAKQTMAAPMIPQTLGVFDDTIESISGESAATEIEAHRRIPPPRTRKAQRKVPDVESPTKSRSPQSTVLTAEGWFDRGYNADDVDERIRAFTEAIRLKPEYTEAYNHRARIRHEKGDFDGAEADGSEAIRLNPNDASLYIDRADIRFDRGNFDAAFADYTAAIQLQPDDARAYFNRALVYQRYQNVPAVVADIWRYLDVGGGVEFGDEAEVEDWLRDYQRILSQVRIPHRFTPAR